MSKVASVGRRFRPSSGVSAQDPRPGWTRFWAPWETSHGKCLCLWQGLGIQWPLKSPPTKSILWFCLSPSYVLWSSREDDADGACHCSFLSQRQWWACEGWGWPATKTVLETDRRLSNSWKRVFISFTLLSQFGFVFFSMQPARISHQQWHISCFFQCMCPISPPTVIKHHPQQSWKVISTSHL